VESASRLVRVKDDHVIAKEVHLETDDRRLLVVNGEFE